ncbi:MAG: amino acid adenylation domain-containing protein [Planctomycetota bacterium]|nr:amino acid adenylation domain-containing protein [Planctomycetota bacterium]
MSMTHVVERFVQAAAHHANRVALEGASHTLTYQQLETESARVSGFLMARGIGKGHVVPILMGRTPRFVVAALGVLRSGAAYSPIDLASPPARQAQVLGNISCDVVLHDDAGASAVRGRSGAVHIDTSLKGEARTVALEEISSEDALDVMYTSGSTGTPKGVVVPHRGVVRLVVNADWAHLDSTRRWLFHSSVAFDASTLEIWGALLHGATCVVQEQPLISFEELARFFVSKRISDAWLTSAVFNAMVDSQVQCFAGVKQLCTGGERESPQHMRKFIEALPQVTLIHGYGPTESTVFSHCHHVRLSDTAPGQRVPIGKPIRGTIDRIELSDGSDAGAGNAGELLVGGLGVALGYRDDPELTIRKFLARDGVPWYRTGDLAVRRAGGEVEFVGRLDRQVKIQGNRIELDEVESVLRSCPGVGDVFIFVDGELAEEKRLVACFTGRFGQVRDADVVRSFMLERLPRIMVPRVLRRVDEFVLKTSGKIDEARMRELVNAPQADDRAGVPARGKAAPETMTEQRLALLWSAWLPGIQIGRHDSLISLGGHSLIAMRLAADIRREFLCDVSPALLLNADSLANAARLIDCAPSGLALTSPDDSTGAGDAPPGAQTVGIQRRLLAASALSASSDAYLVPVAIMLSSRCGLLELRGAFEAIFDRHDMLRLSSAGEGKGPEIFASPPQGWWNSHDRAVDAGGQTLPEWQLAQIYRPMDVASQGPTRVDVWPVVTGGWCVVWTTHHGVIDEWSISLVLQELAALLGKAGLPPAPDARGFLDQETRFADPRQATAQAEAIAGVMGPASLPFADWFGPAVEVEVPLEARIEEAIAAAAQREGTTRVAPAMVAYGLAMQEVFGATWRYVTTPVAKRHSVELLSAVNCCLEMRVLECGVRSKESPAQAIRRVHQDLVRCQERRFVPFDVITAELRRRRPELAALPMQFGFTWRRDPYPVIPINATGREPGDSGGEIRVLRVPQRTTIFGVTLHIEETPHGLRARIEACQECAESGVAERLIRAFTNAASGLGASSSDSRVPPTNQEPHKTRAVGDSTKMPLNPVEADQSAAVGTVLAGVVAACWKEVLGAAPGNDDVDFFDSGGTSFSLLRLVAIIRQRTGATIDGGKVLADSTFGSICRNVLSSRSRDHRTWIQTGDPGAEHTLLLLPGGAGFSLGLCELADRIVAASPVPLRCIIIDLVDIWRLVGRPHPVGQVIDRVLAALDEAGVGRLWGIAGFSLGGPLAVAVEDRLAAIGKPSSRLWIIDGYAPEVLRRDVHLRLARKLVSECRRLWNRVFTPHTGHMRSETREDSDWLICGTMHGATPEIDRDEFQQQVGLLRLGYCNADVVMLRSAIMGRTVNIIRRGATNGFDPEQFRSFTVESAELLHLELLKDRADWTAGIIARTLGVDTCSAPASLQADSLLLARGGTGGETVP